MRVTPPAPARAPLGLAVSLLLLGALGACNTIAGAGEDIQGAGKGVERAAEEVEEEIDEAVDDDPPA